jgi:hypothetical protein
MARCLKSFTKDVDRIGRWGLYSGHRDGDAAGAAASHASLRPLGFVAEQSVGKLVSVSWRCLKTEDRKRNVDGGVLADLLTGKSNETSVCCVLQEPSLVSEV